MLLDKKLPSLRQKLYGGVARKVVKDEPEKVAKTPKKVEGDEKTSKKSNKSKKK